jgi:hypothetical protein
LKRAFIVAVRRGRLRKIDFETSVIDVCVQKSERETWSGNSRSELMVCVNEGLTEIRMRVLAEGMTIMLLARRIEGGSE